MQHPDPSEEVGQLGCFATTVIVVGQPVVSHGKRVHAHCWNSSRGLLVAQLSPNSKPREEAPGQMMRSAEG